MESTSIELRVAGKPKGKGRPRTDGRSGRHFADAATVAGEEWVGSEWLAARRPRLPDGPAVLEVEVVCQRPASHYRTDGSLGAAGLREHWPIRKPDVDNALKLVADALNGLAYRDDVVIVDARVTRRWANVGEHEHTMVRLRPAPVPTLEAVEAVA